MAMIGFLAVVAFVTVSAVWAAGHAHAGDPRGPAYRRAALVAGAWLLVSALPAILELVAPAGPLPAQAILIAVLVVAVAFALSRTGSGIADTVPLHLLVGFQGFRLPLELVLHDWVETGIAPPQMTWTGQNWDVIAGALAIAFLPWVRRSPRVAWVPTVVGSVLLLNVLRVVATSLPGPLQRFPEPITLAGRFPYVWIATVCVAGAAAGHLIAFRALARGRKGS